MIPLVLGVALLLLQEPQGELALKGLDPIALSEGVEVPGSSEHETLWGPYRYRFANEGSKEEFLEEPERWAIMWEGGCGRMGPLSGKGSPERWTVHEGHIYIFASDACREGFLSATERFVPATKERRAPSPADLEEGRRLLERAVAAHGGANRIDAMASLELIERGETQGWQREHALILTREGSIKRRSTWTPPPGEGERYDSIWVEDVAAKDAFSEQGKGTYAMTSPHALDDLRRFAHREPLYLFWARKRPGFEAIALGAGKLGELDVVDVLVREGRLETTLHLDPESYLVRGLSWTGRPLDGVTRANVEVIDGLRFVEGILVASDRSVTCDGKDNENLARPWSEVKVGAKVPRHEFARP